MNFVFSPEEFTALLVLSTAASFTPGPNTTLSTALAANQGLYNGFLAAGLFWGLLLGTEGTDVKLFFLACVLVAGLYGAATANRKILFIQAIPAAIGLLLVLLA